MTKICLLKFEITFLSSLSELNSMLRTPKFLSSIASVSAEGPAS